MSWAVKDISAPGSEGQIPFPPMATTIMGFAVITPKLRHSSIRNLKSSNNYTGMGGVLVLLFIASFETGSSTGGRSLTPKEHNISDIMTKMLAFL
jgi:hypothetical protein